MAQTKTETGPWSSLVSLGIADTAPAVVRDGSTLRVYAGSNTRLYEWTYPVNGGWSTGTQQQWADGSAIRCLWGIGVTKGSYLTTDNQPQSTVFAAIPLLSPAQQVEVAIRSSSTGRWQMLPDDAWRINGEVHKPFTEGQPAIAYKPFESSTPAIGRFYIAWTPPQHWNNIKQQWETDGILMAQTEGNNAGSQAVSRRLIFKDLPIYMANVWQYGQDNVTLLFDRLFDTSLRGAWTFKKGPGVQPIPVFAPFADGTFDGVMKDQDDRIPMKANLRCSLGKAPNCI